MDTHIFINLLLIFVIIAVVVIYQVRFKRYKNSLEKKYAIENENIKSNAMYSQEILRSQIQPHFIYNVLNTIKYLCKKNPNEALEAIDALSAFLRQSMDSLSNVSGVLFQDEIEIVKDFIFLEKKRFGQRLEVKYNITCQDFTVPALSVQTIVENAIKHGITKKIGGGCVWIETLENDTEYQVIITDNGVGFRMEDKKNDDRSHVGIENTNKRLDILCGGHLDIESEIDVMTKVVMHIPKECKSYD